MAYVNHFVTAHQISAEGLSKTGTQRGSQRVGVGLRGYVSLPGSQAHATLGIQISHLTRSGGFQTSVFTNITVVAVN